MITLARSIRYFVFCTLIIGASAVFVVNAKTDDERPNIIIAMVDDMGWSDIGSYGGEISTPNLDKLASNGVRFSQFYNAGRCYPTRASLMTGLHPHQTGIGGSTNSPKGLTGDTGTFGYRGFMNRNSATLAEVLGSAGYHTYMTGKWHLGYHTPDRWPLQRGFERFYGIISGASSYFAPYGSRGLTLDNEALPTPEGDYYTTDAFTDYAIKFIEEQSDDKPFFLYLAYTAPHWPLHAKEKDIQKFVGKYKNVGWDKLREQRYKRMQELGVIDPKLGLSPRDEGARAWDEISGKQKEQLDYRMAVYAAQIYAVDYNLGRLIKTLKKLDKFDNTLIMFLSDNGGCAEPYTDLGGGKFGDINDPSKGGAVSYGQGWANASNTPLRKFKVWVNEGGISTPFIAHWPKGIVKTKNQWIRTPSYLPDIMPTLVELAQTEYPKKLNGYDIQPMEGQSFAKALKTGKLKQQEWMFWEHMKHRAVRYGKWKAVWEKELGEWRLYDIEKDRNEMINLAEQQPKLFKKMTDKWEQWAYRAHVLPYPKKLDVPYAPAITWPAYQTNRQTHNRRKK